MPVEQPETGGVTEPKPFVLTGRHVLASMVLFFAVVAGVNGVMMRIAISTMPGLDARNGYDVSQAYNGEIAAAVAQDGRGWSIRTGIERRPYGTLISADLADAGSGPIGGANVRATLEHPATRQLDRTLTLVETRSGHYEAMSAGLPAGAWTLVLRIEQGGGQAPQAARPDFVSRNRIRVEG